MTSSLPSPNLLSTLIITPTLTIRSSFVVPRFHSMPPKPRQKPFVLNTLPIDPQNDHVNWCKIMRTTGTSIAASSPFFKEGRELTVDGGFDGLRVVGILLIWWSSVYLLVRLRIRKVIRLVFAALSLKVA
jgi:hypothetical protein